MHPTDLYCFPLSQQGLWWWHGHVYFTLYNLQHKSEAIRNPSPPNTSTHTFHTHTHTHSRWVIQVSPNSLRLAKGLDICLCAAAVFWVGLRRGWWVSLISHLLKLINSKGDPKPQRKKKGRGQQQGKKKTRSGSKAVGSEEDGLEESGLVESSPAAAAEAAGPAASAKALFSKMKTKMKGGVTASAEESAERELWLYSVSCEVKDSTACQMRMYTILSISMSGSLDT